jgi:hypothetical protein
MDLDVEHARGVLMTISKRISELREERARSERAAKIVAYCDGGGYAETIDGLLVALGDKEGTLRKERAQTDALVAALNAKEIRGLLADNAPSYRSLGRVRVAVMVILKERERAREPGLVTGGEFVDGIHAAIPDAFSDLDGVLGETKPEPKL